MASEKEDAIVTGGASSAFAGKFAAELIFERFATADQCGAVAADHHFGGAASRVVVARHTHAIRA